MTSIIKFFTGWQGMLIGATLLLAVGEVSGLYFGYQYESGQWAKSKVAEDAAKLKALQSWYDQGRALQKDEDAINQSVGSSAAAAQVKIVTRTVTQLQKVTEYVPAEVVKACTIPLGFIRLLNVNASGSDSPDTDFPIPAGESNASPTTINLDTVSTSIVANYGQALSYRQQVIDLQKWIAETKKKWDADTATHD